MSERQELYNILTTNGLPAYVTGTYPLEQEYPDSFYTFFNQRSDTNSLDNDEIAITYVYTINFYTNNPDILENEVAEIRKSLRNNGYAVSGPYDVKSDEKTHFGKGFICRITKYSKGD